MRVLVFGCAAADAVAPPRSVLATTAAAVRRRGHTATVVWHSLRWASALPLGEHASGAAVLRRIEGPDELDPCALADAVDACARAALADAVRVADPDAVVVHADDARPLACDPPHPWLLVIDDASAVRADRPATVARFEAWLAAGRGAVAAWRATPAARPSRRLRLARP